jgi:hypothetical protein
MTWRLIGPDGREHPSDRPGTFGGHRRSRIYGCLDCPSALRALARGGYRTHRVFFADATTAVQAGYRPCGVCLPEEHRAWKNATATGDTGWDDDAPAGGPTGASSREHQRRWASRW